jgi:hypothetical protein
VHWFSVLHDKDQLGPMVNTVMNLRIKYRERNFLTRGKTTSFLRGIILHGVIN